MSTKYLIKKQTITKTMCKSCQGSGTTGKFSQTCGHCGGSKFEKTYHSTEVSLMDALYDLGLINKNK